MLLSADYKQMELRLMAHFSEDPVLIAMLSDPGQDPFRTWAHQWLKIPLDQVPARSASRRCTRTCMRCLHGGHL